MITGVFQISINASMITSIYDQKSDVTSRYSKAMASVSYPGNITFSRAAARPQGSTENEEAGPSGISAEIAGFQDDRLRAGRMAGGRER